MRRIDLIVIHCADTYSRMDIGVKEIDQWHKERGWKGVGYHYVIRRNGVIELGRPESEIGSHVTGHNSHSIGICWVGGKGDYNEPEDNRTDIQKQALRSLINGLHSKYPDAIIAGHNEYNKNKACPCFNVQAEFGWLNKTNNNEKDVERDMELVEREENESKYGSIDFSTRNQTFRPEPIDTRTVGSFADNNSLDRRLELNTQGVKNEYSKKSNEYNTEFYHDKIEKSIRSQIKWQWNFSIPIEKIINFFKQLKRR